MSKFKIAWLFPDTLFLHGERGNLLALARFAQMAGYEPVIDKIDFRSEKFVPEDYDVIFAAPGEISSFPAVRDWLLPYKPQLREYVDSGRPMIVTGTSVGLFGKQVLRSDGSEFEGLGIIFTQFSENKDVYGDDIWFECEYNDAKMEIMGNQIQMGDLNIVSETPFGHLKYGYGNTGKDQNEGVLRGNSIFTNTLGPILVCNPWLTEEVIRTAARIRGHEMPEFTYDPKLEKASFATKKKFTETKETRLTNCSR